MTDRASSAINGSNPLRDRTSHDLLQRLLNPYRRTLIVDCLSAQGVEHVFCVPGESYLAVLDALHDAAIGVTVCRQEGGATMMAETTGRLTGRPGVAMVTRGPGATNASAGVHIAEHDSTPLICSSARSSAACAVAEPGRSSTTRQSSAA